MKVSIWQQFSSNHSAAFSIVAQFETHEKAVQVADEIKTLLLETYRMLDPDDSYSGLSYETPAQIKQQFEFDTQVGVSWILNEQHVRRALQVFGNTIFVSDHPGYSNFDSSDNFFEKMLERQGGKIVAAVEAGAGYVYMTIQARAKDEATAQHIIDTSEKPDRAVGQPYYIPEGIPNTEGADGISREGSIIIFERIYFSPFNFDTFSPWYSYLIDNNFTDVTITITEYKGKDEVVRTIELPFEGIRGQVHTPFWAIFKSQSIRTYPQVAIATLKTNAEAKVAAATIQQILNSVRDWADENVEASLAVWDTFWEQLSAPEQEFQQKYNIEWTHSIVEWLHASVRIRPVEDIVCVLNNRLLVANGCNTWIGVAPFHLIIPQLGATTVDVPSNGMYRYFTCDITVNAPSENLVWHIKDVIETLQKQDIPPWLYFYGGNKVENPEMWQKSANSVVENTKKVREIHQHLSSYWNAKVRNASRYDDVKLGRVEEAEFLELLYGDSWNVSPDFEQTTMKARLRDLRLQYLEIKHDGKQLRIEHVLFRELCTLQLLPAFSAWLDSQGCEVEISFYESRTKHPQPGYFRYQVGKEEEL